MQKIHNESNTNIFNTDRISNRATPKPSWSLRQKAKSGILLLSSFQRLIFCSWWIFKKRLYRVIFRERGREGEREAEKHQCVVAPRTPQTVDLPCNPGVCPDWELIQQLFSLQNNTQPTKPHQSEPSRIFYMDLDCFKKHITDMFYLDHHVFWHPLHFAPVSLKVALGWKM